MKLSNGYDMKLADVVWAWVIVLILGGFFTYLRLSSDVAREDRFVVFLTSDSGTVVACGAPCWEADGGSKCAVLVEDLAPVQSFKWEVVVPCGADGGWDGRAR